MKRVILFVISVLLAATTVAQEQITVKIDKKQRWQRIEGWGSSLCWWANMCGRWDEEKVDKLLDLITSKDGLNMNIFRYNIGGGDDPTHIGGHMVEGKGKRAAAAAR